MERTKTGSRSKRPAKRAVYKAKKAKAYFWKVHRLHIYDSTDNQYMSNHVFVCLPILFARSLQRVGKERKERDACSYRIHHFPTAVQMCLKATLPFSFFLFVAD